MAVEAVASGVIQKVTDLLIQECVIFDKVIDQVEDIRLELRQMRGFFMYAEELQHTDKDVKKWVQDYLETLYQVEDMVESYVLKLARKKRGMSFFQNYGFFFHDTGAWQKLRTKMKDIDERIKNLKMEKPQDVKDASLRGNSSRWEESRVPLGDAYTPCLTEHKRSSSSSNEKENSDFVGFTDEDRKLEKRLVEENGNIIGVYGSLGSGKTTLVKRIYERKTIKEHFNCHVWLNVSEEHILKDLLLKVWHEVDVKRDGDFNVLDELQLKGKLQEHLQRQKYLIVLDDVRKQPDKWRELIGAFPLENGSKVVFTTREENIAEFYKEENQLIQLIRLEGLNHSHSRELLNRTLHDEYGNCFHLNATLWDKILPICKGLPLNLQLLGGILSTKKTGYEELLSHDDRHQSEIWLLSYNDLPANYKLCLLYLALFPKESDVSVRRVLRLWLAEGFLRRSPGSPGLSEDLAEECFNYLVKRKLVKISKFRSDGGPKKCRLPGFLREKLSPKAQEIKLFYIHQKSAGSSDFPVSESGARRIVEYADIKDYANGSKSNSSHVENLRSYLSFKFSRYDTPTKEVGDFLRKTIGKRGFGLLRVLDLEGVYKPELPASLKHLFQLRYLGLRSTFLDTLPESVGSLSYLETLDLKRTYVNRLPSSVWTLEHLRHLNLPHIRLDMRVQQLRSQLLTLWGLTIDDECNMESGLHRLLDLRELGITCQLKQFDGLKSWIARLTRLCSLSLISKDETGRPSDLSLEPLPELCKLSHLKLLGKISPPLTEDHFPPNLKVLTLSLSQLTEDPMKVLSKLPCLIVLRLLAKSYVGPKMNCEQNGFRSLRVLKLWMLHELEEWTVQSGGMPNIRELNVRCCHKLKELPLELLKRTTLELVLTTHKDPQIQCMQKLEQHVTTSKLLHTNPTINRYDFSPLPWEKDADLWN